MMLSVKMASYINKEDNQMRYLLLLENILDKSFNTLVTAPDLTQLELKHSKNPLGVYLCKSIVVIDELDVENTTSAIDPENIIGCGLTIKDAKIDIVPRETVDAMRGI